MHQIRFRLGLRPRPRWGAYSAPQPPSCIYIIGAYVSANLFTVDSRRIVPARQKHEREDALYKCTDLLTYLLTSVVLQVVQILFLIGLYLLKCTKFDQLILRKIIKNFATRCQILTLKCTKIDFNWGSAPDTAEGAYSAPPDPQYAGQRFWKLGQTACQLHGTLAKAACRLHAPLAYVELSLITNFYTRDTQHSAVFAAAACLSVSPSICPSISHTGIVSKWLNLS